MKLSLDPYMFRQVPLLELPGLVADLGYQWLELSPRDDFLPFFNHPRVDDARVAAFKAELEATGVGVSSVLPLYKWSGPDEDERQAAVRYWKRAIRITAELGVDVMNSEFNGRPEQAARSESQFWRSMEELLPVFEAEGPARPRAAPRRLRGGRPRRDRPDPRDQQSAGELPVLRTAHVPHGQRRRGDHRVCG